MHNKITYGKNRVEQLRKSWTYKSMLSYFFLMLGFTNLVYAVIVKFFVVPLYLLLFLFIVLALLVVFFERRSRFTNEDVSRFLNINFPTLEESAELVLKPRSGLNLLESFQLAKVEKELLLVQGFDPVKKRLRTSFIVLILAVLAGFAIFKMPGSAGVNTSRQTETKLSSVQTIPEKILAEIQTAKIIIAPPAYTGRTSRQQNRFNLLAEEGAVVTWQIQTSIKADNVQLLFNDGKALPLSYDGEKLNWRTQKQINRNGFYQVKIDDALSELYRIETVKDKLPVIQVQSPKPNTLISYGQSETFVVKGLVADDYGIRNTYISATISSGQGEGVKFKEQKISFPSFRIGQREFQIQRMIDCRGLGMKPGDELYFFIGAIDNHNQEARSEVFIVTLQDTTNLSSMNGMVKPLDIKAELFRSQRQIIIETEQLLKNKGRITTEAFTKKSNDLGVDQKLLRMRYGKFLGEETDVEIGAEHHDEDEGEAHADEAEDIVKQYSHLHDNAEDATFFDAETKKQLKETLAEMWNAEMKLRTISPKEALPFEYKALRLLKDLQQKSRVYVAKTGLKTTPLQPDKRLTGDLSKISQPVKRENILNPESQVNTVRKALGTLEELKMDGRLSIAGKEILHKAFFQLSAIAAEQPSFYIPSLSALKNILNEKFRVRDIIQAQQGLQRMGSPPEKLPYSESDASNGLSKQYFYNLKNAGRP